ncbi:unnamed protein product [Tetraodon nigroviridis]|uniref:(spotted green pufferfish) hypothetical protein n=1 Tax=Tetraodon nigroviridis TaxID=99883 RepID=Q4SFM0_TETNG|nr:unnamed protein product [Tetraodon nigroviridis]
MPLLLSVLGVVLCSLLCSSDVSPQAEFNLQMMAGKWHLIGFASNSEWFISRKASMKMGTAIFTPTLDGDLNLSHASLRPDGSCWRMADLVKKTDTPGKFSYSTNFGEGNDMIVVDVKYDEFALVHVVDPKGEHLTVVNKLYGRSQVLPPDLLEKFQQFSLETGILPENIVPLPQNGECPDV